MGTSLDEILDGTATKEPQEVKAETPEPSETPAVEEPKAETLEEPKAEEPKAEKPEDKPAEEPEKTVPIAALHETREQLKKARQQNEELTGLFKKLEPHLQKPDSTAEKPDDFYADPQGFVERLVAKASNETQETQTRAFLNLSEANARSRHEDYETTIQEFAGMVEQNPDLRKQMLQQVDPGEWSYQMAKRHAAMKDLGDPATARERLTAELRETVKAELTAEAEAEAKPDTPVPSLPKSLAKTRNAGARKGPAWAGPTPLDEMFPSG